MCSLKAGMAGRSSSSWFPQLRGFLQKQSQRQIAEVKRKSAVTGSVKGLCVWLFIVQILAGSQYSIMFPSGQTESTILSRLLLKKLVTAADSAWLPPHPRLTPRFLTRLLSSHSWLLWLLCHCADSALYSYLLSVTRVNEVFSFLHLSSFSIVSNGFHHLVLILLWIVL